MTITPNDLTWIFQDPDWRNKFLVGSLLIFAATLVPLLGYAGYVLVFGYALIEMRAQIRGEESVLPKWDRWGELFVDGLKAILAEIGYLVPGLVVIFLGVFAWFASFVVGIATTASSGREALFPLSFVGGELIFFVAAAIGSALFLIGMLPAPLAIGQYARTGQMSAGYRWAEMRTIFRANMGGFVLAWVVYLGVGVVLNYIILFLYFTVILCFFLSLVIAPVSFYLALTFAHLFGKAYREGALKAGLLSA